ncbi:hypothetical protein [Ruegeria sp. Ofav3-42]|uniref:hypothetical protein n=1 Tax=Ruegeria sp. Ofav3-42 TaxID=2917759 RepID=UPI001EF4925D|nr:hypothetical protein [Ruegeria sp. Ofav3-42]MCG7522699.1 hypothetical protein [Ruegeria sp. Ofav3-42]
MVETALVYHDTGLWTAHDLAYLGPSEEIALRENEDLSPGLNPDILTGTIHWPHNIAAYSGHGADIVNSVRKGDWIDATGSMVRKRLTKQQVAQVEAAIPIFGFDAVRRMLTKELGGNAFLGSLRVVRGVLKL